MHPRFWQERAEREQASRLEAERRREEEEEQQRRVADQGAPDRIWFRAISYAREDKWEDIADLLRTLSPRWRKQIMLRPLAAQDSAVGFRSHHLSESTDRNQV